MPLEKDGKFVAELKCAHGSWQQVGGQALDNSLILLIGNKIEDHFR
jgi:hypothetical protein